ncbi:MAG: alpha/beta fold hydrolase [Roseiflexaceae bacterium]|nr:alpha/beta fold hydrolase [Roseiflexaceae bacterium]
MPTVMISGAKLFYRDEGQGAPLLLIHAFPLNSVMWEPQIAALAPRMRVIAPDLPGFGQSNYASGDSSLDRYADTLAALLDHLELDRTAVLGLSMGGYIAFALLRRHAVRVSALVLADTKAGADSDEAKAKRTENAAVAMAQGQAAIAERVLPTLLSPDAPDSLRAHVRELIDANSREGIAAALRSMARRPDSSDMLAGIAVPTAVIVGEHDTLTPPSESEHLASSIPGATLTVIPGAAHISNLEQPEAFNSALLQFFA